MQDGFGNDTKEKFKIFYEDPETKGRSFVEVDYFSRQKIADRMADAKHSDMVVIPGVGEIKKGDVKAITRVGLREERTYKQRISSKKRMPDDSIWRIHEEVVTTVHPDGTKTHEYRMTSRDLIEPAPKKESEQQWLEYELKRLEDRKLITGLPDPRIADYRKKLLTFSSK
jgi:hypothetical protein